MNTNSENDLLQADLVVINIGLRSFAVALEDQDVEVIHVEWSPPAGGDKDMEALLEQLL